MNICKVMKNISLRLEYIISLFTNIEIINPKAVTPLGLASEINNSVIPLIERNENESFTFLQNTAQKLLLENIK